MQFKKREFFLQAIQEHGLKVDLDFYADDIESSERIGFPVPAEHSRILSFTKFLLEISSPSGELLVMPTEWGTWPSSENWHLYEAICKNIDDKHLLNERPCHLFGPTESELAVDFIYLFVLFSWDFYIFSYRENDLLFVSHDGFGLYHSPHRVDDVRREMEIFYEGESWHSPRRLDS